MIGALSDYISDESVKNFQPMGANFGVLPAIEPKIKDKKERYAKTWLMRILINECYNIARRINVNEPLDEGYAENRKQPKENRDYSELYRAVNELKEELRIPVILYYMEEFNIREIAQILEISEGAVQKRLVRARKTLKKKIQLEEIFI